MYRPCSAFLCVVVIIIIMTSGCTSSQKTSPSPLISSQETTPAATSLPGTAGTAAPGACSADVSGDAANCGGCGYACPANALCQAGKCYCKEGFTLENNHCVVAPAGIISGNSCPPGMSPCADGYCYELASSPANCGLCGNACPAGMICIASTCTSVPTEVITAAVTAVTTSSTGPLGTVGVSKFCLIKGLTNCDGTCVNLTTSHLNCGSCGHTCKGIHGICCGGTCTNLQDDPLNCGSCGNKCKFYGSVCEDGSCKITMGKVALP